MLRQLWKCIGRRAVTTTSRSPAFRRLGLYLEPLEDRRLLAVTLDFAGTQTIVGGTNINVSNDYDDADPRIQSEMTLDVNPTNPLNLAGFSHDFDIVNEVFDEIKLFFSIDGGTRKRPIGC